MKRKTEKLRCSPEKNFSWAGLNYTSNIPTHYAQNLLRIAGHYMSAGFMNNPG